MTAIGLAVATLAAIAQASAETRARPELAALAVIVMTSLLGDVDGTDIRASSRRSQPVICAGFDLDAECQHPVLVGMRQADPVAVEVTLSTAANPGSRVSRCFAQVNGTDLSDSYGRESVAVQNVRAITEVHNKSGDRNSRRSSTCTGLHSEVHLNGRVRKPQTTAASPSPRAGRESRVWS